VLLSPEKEQALGARAAADAHGLALALPEMVVMARPTGFEPARTHLEFRMIPIERAEQWDAALRNGA
jgi:hypothetical protein